MPYYYLAVLHPDDALYQILPLEGVLKPDRQDGVRICKSFISQTWADR